MDSSVEALKEEAIMLTDMRQAILLRYMVVLL